jgi:hypothetical protein
VPAPPRRCRKWAASGGKSNAYFAKTRDDRFIVKSLSKAEKASFLDFAPAYFEYLANKMGAGAATCLAKVGGRAGWSGRRAEGGARRLLVQCAGPQRKRSSATGLARDRLQTQSRRPQQLYGPQG